MGKPIYYDELPLRIRTIAYIDRLVNENIDLAVSLGYKQVDYNEMVIRSLKNYNHSLKKRIRKKELKNKGDTNAKNVL